jgi:flagellar biosynthesis regulator FlaF
MTQSQQEKVGAYGAHQQVQIDGREIDKRALLNCANRLRTALDDDGKDMNLYAAAIRHNQHLWTIFQVALADPANELPRDLKMTLLRLSGYIDRVSFRAITAFAPQLLNSLIDINRALAAGLAKKPQTQQAQGPAANAPATAAGMPAAIMTSA